MSANKKIYLAIPPGESLSDILKTTEMSQVELAKRTGLSEKHISQIINGEAPITPKTAIKFERVFGGSASFWNNLEKNYQESLAKIEAEKIINEEIGLLKNYTCYNELVKYNFIEPAESKIEKVNNLLKFFKVDSLSLITDNYAIAYRGLNKKIKKESLMVWLRCGEIKTESYSFKNFNKTALLKNIPKLKELTKHRGDFGDDLKKICTECGIAICFTPYFKNTYINGATRWFKNNPLIQLNTKGAFSDIFWFSFFHELGHILLHGKRDKFLSFSKEQSCKIKEKEADAFAINTLINDVDAYKKLSNQKPVKKTEIIELATTENIDKGIIIGRLAKEGKISWQIAHKYRRRLIIA